MPGKLMISQRTVFRRPLFFPARAGRVALGAVVCVAAALAISEIKITALLGFFSWLGDTPWSSGLHESQYAYSIIESVHVWTLALFFGTVVMFDLRLLGLTMRNVPVSQVVDRLLPWTIAGFIIMVVTGSLLFFAIPLRSFQNLFFRFKMILLISAALNIWLFHRGIYPNVTAWDAAPVPPRRVRMAGAISLALWTCIVISGRMIAYNWFDCDRQPQPAIINFLTSCIAGAANLAGN